MAWVVTSLLALLALVFWQREPGVTALAVASLSVTASVWWIHTVRHPRWWAWATTAVLAVTSVLAISDTVTLRAIATDWSRWSVAERETRANDAAEAVAEVARIVRERAVSVVGDSALLARLVAGDPAARASLTPPLGPQVESGLLVFRRGVLIGRAGQLRTAVPVAGVPGLRLVDEPFYSSLTARAVSADGDVQVVAVALITAMPPADQFARALTQSMNDRIVGVRTLVESPDSTRVDAGSTVVVVPDGQRRLARVRALARSADEVRLSILQRARARTAVPLAVAALLVLVAAWRRPARTPHRVATALTLGVVIACAPLNALSNVSPVFDAASYFAPMGGALTANVAALMLTAALALTTLFVSRRSGRVTRLAESRRRAALLVLVSAVGGPILVRDLARGIALPAAGFSVPLWIAWQLGLALVAAVVLQVGAVAGRTALGTRRGLPAIVAPTIALGAALLAPLLWRAPGEWPAWYPILWGAAIVALALTRRSVALVTGAAVIAAAGATTLTWGAAVRARMDRAQHDLSRLSAVDDSALRLLQRFAATLAQDPQGAAGPDGLLRRYAASELALAGYPARLTRWDAATPEGPVTDLRLTAVVDSLGAQAALASTALKTGQATLRAVAEGPITVLIAAVPAADGTVTTVAVPPRIGMLPADPFASLTGIAATRDRETPYRLSLVPLMTPATTEPDGELTWRRRGDVMHGDGVVSGGGITRGVHAEVDMRSFDTLVPRGALLMLLDVLVVSLLWSASAMADGGFGRWLRLRRARLAQSYRVRLSGALLTFFILPATLFAGWSAYRLQDDDQASRELLVREALRTAASDVVRGDLAATATSVGSPLFVFRDAELVAGSDSLLQALAPLGRLLPVSLDERDFGADDQFTTRRVAVGRTQALVGYRRLPSSAGELVVVTPARGDEYALDARREDLGMLLLFTVALGALAAVWLSGIASRSLSQPVGALQEAALAIAAGGDTQALGRAPASEFAPVYTAFGRMAEDLSASRMALEAAQRRTEAVLQHVDSGVVAVRADDAILLANPRAEQLLGIRLRGIEATLADWPPALELLRTECRQFLAGVADDAAFELMVTGRQLRGRLTRLRGGCVLTVDDLTDLASAQRVLAWGEMARQVAHEIKNPLTPIRLGVQHLRRAYRDGRSDFGAVLDSNVTRVLAEIDHLDEIARAFSRYGMAPEQRPVAQAVDVVAIVQDVLALERLGESEVSWLATVPAGNAPVLALAQPDELREVLLNVLENARLASAQTVRVTVEPRDGQVLLMVRDDGHGVPAEVLAQVFEPHFSTRTSGSGLGLAICRRLVESWGGRIGLESPAGAGTVVQVTLLPASPTGLTEPA